MVFELTEEIGFPDPRLGEESGIFAIGGDLSTERLLLAYQYGIFPWYDFRKGIPQWWCPMQRFVIFPDEIHVSHSLRNLINKGRYTFSFNQAFEKVISECGRLREHEQGAWLGDDIKEAYTRLHKLGFCSSVEVWEGDALVGGLYGVVLSANDEGTQWAFFGESMFSLVPSASKLALVFLSRFMRTHGGVLIDCQLHTPHLESMGGRFISYDDYLRLLGKEDAIDNGTV